MYTFFCTVVHNARYMRIGSHNILSVYDELGHISSWAARKHLHLNPAKTREKVIIRLNWPSIAASPPIVGGSRSSTVTILGIIINERLSVSGHMD